MKTIVKRRPLGKTGVDVSVISFGAMNLRMLPDHETVNKLINDVLDQGINLIDTARAYDTLGPGHQVKGEAGVFISSEIMLGKAISARDDIDEPLVIVTKGHGYTPETFDAHLKESHERLQIRSENGKLYIGKTEIRLVYLMHGIKDDRWDSILSSGVLDHAKKKQGEGLFTFLGFSSHYGDTQVIKAAIESGYYQVCELPYNVYNPSLGEEGKIDLIKLAYDSGLGIINMKAFNGNGTTAIFKQINGLTGIGYGDMARYCLSNPCMSTIDAGVRSLDELLTDINASNEPPMTLDERAALREKAVKISPYLNSICRECMHCLEKFACPQNVDFPKILGTHGRYSISKSLGFDTGAFKAEFGAYNPSASACIACGNCNEWCEYHLDIPSMIATAVQELG